MPSASPSGPISIRPATAADLPAIVAMRNALNDLERAGCPHAAIQRLTLDEFTAVWGPTLASPTHCWRIVEHGGQPTGFGLIYLLFPQLSAPAAFVQWAYLDAAHRGQGVGEKLFAEMMEWARAKRATRIELQFIDGNTLAERFWSKLDFRPYARKCVLELRRAGSVSDG
jgi:GNAT superfamily N-acetyltransferase